MNNVMDQELAEAKSDLADALKDIERLEKELEAVYDKQDQPQPQPVPQDNSNVIRVLEQEIAILRGYHQTQLHEREREQIRNTRDRNNMLRALALVEIIRLNQDKSLDYFKTKQGQDSLQWVSAIYQSEVNRFLTIRNSGTT